LRYNELLALRRVVFKKLTKNKNICIVIVSLLRIYVHMQKEDF